MITSTLILMELGSLVVYKKFTEEQPQGDGKYYYVDRRFLIEQGPFEDPKDATAHWTSVIIPLVSEQNKPPLPENVIKVDFKNRCRVKR